MSESSLHTDVSHETGTTDTGQLASTSIPLATVPAYKHLKQSKDSQGSVPQLPSHRFQYSVWHDLKVVSIKGTDLKAPRIRDGPDEKEAAFYSLKDEDNQYIHHNLHGRRRITHQTTMENWEQAKSASFCYQDLSDAYQRKHFQNILGRLRNVEQLYLVDNGMQYLHSYSFPKCEVLNINNNYIASFKYLPSIPRVKLLTMEDNDVDNFKGLGNLKSLEDLYLRGNPITFLINYRQRVFQILPQLKRLDGIPRLQSDLEFDPEYGDMDESMNDSSCVIL
ncbi:uncharacterized protein LOC143057221 [Mytilus galloprovincialis]|uniref:uncharacterized protein LOC143057221 n=1 Tax=Mytilus galloprovincialis TaxID=29158 RepID=UPI003F7C8162